MNLMTITTGVSVLFALEFAGVATLEFVAKRRARRRAILRALPDLKPRPALFVVEDEDGRTRVFERALGFVEEEDLVQKASQRAANHRAEPVHIMRAPCARG